MDAHVGSNGPGAIGMSSFISGNDRESPIGTLSSACGGGTGGVGASEGRVAQPAIAASSATPVINRIPFLTMFISFMLVEVLGERACERAQVFVRPHIADGDGFRKA